MTASDSPIEVVRSVAALRRRVADWRAAGEVIGLVPTMGALHAGHLSLVERALAYTTRSCVSLFVNPAQFGPSEDFQVYPRDEAGDLAKLAGVGAHLVFAPPVDEMYPTGAATLISVSGLGDILEGEFRPGFFTGVATVVAKLLIQALPDVALFGEKDFQQLLVIRRMVTDLHLPVRIESARTVREGDGLALSSRNAYLSADERAVAPALFRTLSDVASRIAEGASPTSAAEQGAVRLKEAGFSEVDYVTARDAATLEPLYAPGSPGRVLAAARLGKTRLIDNVPVPAHDSR
jgi:pantoate--beta-alanine ligase